MKSLWLIPLLACAGAVGLLCLGAKPPEAATHGRLASVRVATRDGVNKHKGIAGDSTRDHTARNGNPEKEEAKEFTKVGRFVTGGGTIPGGGNPDPDNSIAAGIRSLPDNKAPDVKRIRIPEKNARPVLPLAFQEVSPGSILLEPAQAAAAAAVQDGFADAVGADSVDAAARDYHNKWQREQPVSDQRLRSMIGGQAWVRWQREAWIHSRSASNEKTGNAR